MGRGTAFEKLLESAAISLELGVFEPFVGIVVLSISIMRFTLICGHASGTGVVFSVVS